MKNFVLIIILFFGFQVNAQKSIEQIVSNSKIKTVIVNDDKVFKINIKNSSNNAITIQSRIEGEYTKGMIVSSEAKNDTLYISSRFLPFYRDHNDKLSAHKVLSIEIDLWIPKQLNVYVNSAMASANIDGEYNYLTLELAQGNTNVSNFNGNAIINSVNGNIKLETNNAAIEAFSKTGTVTKEELTLGANQIKVNTINGNINVIKTKK